MASTDRIFVSPGVFTSEKDLTFVTRQVGVTTLGLLGETPKGPAFEPVFISNYDEFTSYFGSLDPEKFNGTGYQKYELNYIAKSYLTQTNQLYVSRVLGLSGYDAGNAWSITLESSEDPSTIGTTGTNTYTGGTQPLLTYSASTGGTPVTLTWGDSNLEALYDDGQITSLFTSLGLKDTGDTISLTSPKYVKNSCDFSGATFDMEVTEQDTSGSDPAFVTGVTSGTVVNYTASCYTDIDGSVLATIRSRGTYDGNEDLIYDVTGATDTGMSDITSIKSDAKASFTITGTASNGNSFTYDVSMDNTKKNFLPRVFGSSTQDKETELWVEEIYTNVLNDLVTAGKVRGLNTSFLEIGEGTSNDLNNYKEQWKSAASPWVLSELKGTGVGKTLQRLFRFVTISDGNAANEDVKFSIINIKPDDKTFDLLIRSFGDTDANPSVLEKFSSLSLDSTATGYIARKIGTTDGEYPLRSRYIMVELYDENDPDLVNHFPAGFEGVLNRTYIGNRTGLPTTGLPPKIEYKTQYTDFNTSKLRKTYLGLNSGIGVDQDFFDYKGLNKVNNGVFTGKTDGFHLDVNADGAMVELGTNSYTPVLQVGVSAFTTDASLQGGPYEKLAARKFTFAPFGGWDGWDEYRTERTNGDAYTKTGTKGSIGFASGLFSTYVTSEGDDGITSDYYAFLDGIYTFNNPEAVNINVFATPGLDLRDQPGLIENAVDMVEVDRADSLYIITTPDTDDDGLALTPGEAIDIVEDSAIDSNYSATYWPWLQMNDTENNRYVWLPPTLEVVRNIALTDNIAFPWFASAGLNRGVTNAIKARLKLKLGDRDDLYEGRINPMATFSDVGVVIFGNKTLQVKETALNRINVRRLLLQARKLISAVSIRLLFEQNDDVVRNQFLNLVNPILDNIRKERGLTDFRVVLDDTPESIDRNELNGRIFIKPTRSLEFISIEFNITNTGASFDDI